jgi:hypothetical protein
MSKVLIDRERLATSVKPLHHRIFRDSRHVNGSKGWLAADDSFSTAVDAVASLLLHPGINDDVSGGTTPSPFTNLIASC